MASCSNEIKQKSVVKIVKSRLNSICDKVYQLATLDDNVIIKDGNVFLSTYQIYTTVNNIIHNNLDYGSSRYYDVLKQLKDRRINKLNLINSVKLLQPSKNVNSVSEVLMTIEVLMKFLKEEIPENTKMSDNEYSDLRLYHQLDESLDSKSIMSVCLFYLLDDSFCPLRLQRILMYSCENKESAQFLIWCLLSILETATDESNDHNKIHSIVPIWLNSVYAFDSNKEKSLKIAKNSTTVSIHPIIRAEICKNMIDVLTNIATDHPTYFIPNIVLGNDDTVVKQNATTQEFWIMVQENGKVPELKDWAATPLDQFEQSPFVRLIGYFDKPTIMESDKLREKLLKVADLIIRIIPNDISSKLGNDNGYNALCNNINNIIRSIVMPTCSSDGMEYGLSLLSNFKNMFPSTGELILNQFIATIIVLGNQWTAQIENTIEDLKQKSHRDEQNTLIDEESNNKTDRKKEYLKFKKKKKDVKQSVDQFEKTVDIPLLRAIRTFVKVNHSLKLDNTELSIQLSFLRSLWECLSICLLILEEHYRTSDTLLPVVEAFLLVHSSSEKDTETLLHFAGKHQNEVNNIIRHNSEYLSSGKLILTLIQFPKLLDFDIKIKFIQTGVLKIDKSSLWDLIFECMLYLENKSSPTETLELLKAAESLFFSIAASNNGIIVETEKIVELAKTHKTGLNRFARSNIHLLLPHCLLGELLKIPAYLDFDIKLKSFRLILEQTNRRNPSRIVPVVVNRSSVFTDSFNQLAHLTEFDWKHIFRITFRGEGGLDYGGLLREWYTVITREIFNPNYALFTTAPGDMISYMINKASYINPVHLDYFKFVGRIIAKSIIDDTHLDCHFTRAFYKHILNQPVEYTDLESEDPAFFKSLDFLLNNSIDDLYLEFTFSTDIEIFGVLLVKDLIENGRNVEVNDVNKDEYVKLVCQMKMTGSIKQQIHEFISGFYDIIPKDLISMFNEKELELLICGQSEINIQDLSAHTEYKDYQKTDKQIKWFWEALKSFGNEDKAKLLMFVTGSSKVPLEGFSMLKGSNGFQKFTISKDYFDVNRLPTSHTCFNQLDLPQYDSYEKLRTSLYTAIQECTEGFGFS